MYLSLEEENLLYKKYKLIEIKSPTGFKNPVISICF